MRSWVDPLSNSVILPPELIEEHLEELIQAQIPPEFLTSFAHEFCHHWCFQSGVGAISAIIFMRAAQESLRQDGVSARAADMGARSEAIIHLLRPLLEGLALFTEFDIRRGSSPESSVPLSWTTLVALPLIDSMDPLNPYDIAARLMRDPQYALHRKETLLTTPYDPEKSPYLFGYLAIKATWLARLGVSDHEETDGFLMLVFVHLLNDPELILALCSTDIGTVDAIKHIAERIDIILAALADPFKTPLEALWPRQPHDGLNDRAWLPKVPGISEEVSQRAREALKEALAEFDATGSEEDAGLSLIWETFLYRRQFVTIGMIELVISRQEEGVKLHTLSGYDIELVEASWLLNGTSGSASLELLLCPAANAFLIAVFQNGRVVGALPVHVGDGKILSSFTDWFVPTSTAIALTENIMIAVLHARESLDPAVLPTLKEAKRRVHEALERPVALILDDTARASLRKSGFWRLCGGLDRLRNLCESTLTEPLVSSERFLQLFGCDESDELTPILTNCPARLPGVSVGHQLAILA